MSTMASSTAADGKKKRKQGGFKTMPFILANEICDRFATSGFGANMITYLTQQLHLPLVEASNILTVFTGTSSLTPVLGALAADSFAGRFWTITAGSIMYQIGMLGLTVSALVPVLRPPPCSPPGNPCRGASGGQLSVLYLSLLCTSLGSGGLRPCVVAFGADQFGLNAARQRAEMKWSFFNLYFFSMGIAVLLALAVVVYIQDNVGWGWGFGVPAIAMFISVVAFVIGYPLYVKIEPGGSPFTRLAQVLVAAFKKRKEAVPDEPSMLYQDKKLDAVISAYGRLLHTSQLKFFDRAAIVTNGDIKASGEPNLWRLSTVHRIEELKSIMRLLPIWSAGVLSSTAGSHNGTFAIQQASTMDCHLSPHFQIPPATMTIFATISTLITLAFYDRVVVPTARHFTGRPSGITYFQRMGIGFAISILGIVAAALVEDKRRTAAADNGLLDNAAAVVPISVFWLVPQHAIHGISDAWSTVGHMEFLYDQAPESMRSTAIALFWLAGSIGNYLGAALVTVVQHTTRKSGEWLQDNINMGRLDLYYWLVACLMVLNLCYYILCVQFYTMKPLEVDVRGEDRDGEEVDAEETELSSA